jgi:copper homeostasis protein
VFSADELTQMRAEIGAVRRHGIEGVVLGASLPDGRLDHETLAALAEASQGMKRTLHRAFDLVPDIAQAVEQAIDLGFDTILTSGRAASALAGLADLAAAQEAAAGRITIMAGAGIDAVTARQILGAVPLGAVHGSCSAPAPADNAIAAHLGFSSTNRRSTDAQRVSALKAALGEV